MEKKKKAIVIHPDDNVAVVLEEVAKGEEVKYWERGKPCLLVARDTIAKGHKVAIQSIASLGRVVKYGFPIGIALRQIKKGELVHTHNLISSTIEGSS